MAWFGPKGVATMTFSLLVLGEGIPDAGRIFNLAALCVFASVLAHGLTDTPGSEWLAVGVKRGLLLGVRERPRGLPATLLPEHEAHLLRRAQALRMVRAEGRARLLERERAETVLAKEAVLATDLLDLPHCHNPSPLVHQSVTSRALVERAERGRSRGARRDFPHSARFSSEFPLGGHFHAYFALLATHPPRTLGTYC